ncbi:hypothetical protein GCM10007933_09500 [Zoogloea oryzae]|jgi:hypothetical protein|uniref:Uncharacterized protein n=1 Tax=Zoogloea oryzae TaxID=310767 RepID=A0ABQ6F7I6_9RHOO|nr:hypothetical protein [Zoogloea oryzae]GLT21498.1 hypothetical protein GCM10007933_09500 [Zoogloea oryzae]
MIPTNHPIPLDAGVARLVALLDEDRYEFFAERAGVLEFDARMARIDAERQALIQTLARYGFPGQTKVGLLQIKVDGGTRWVLAADELNARQRLAGLGVTEVLAADLVDVLHRQFGDLAWLATSP